MNCESCGKEVSYWGSNDVDGKTYCNDCYLNNFGSLNNEGLKDETQKVINTIIISSLFIMEKKTIDKYYDLISAEVVLGTGIFSEFDAATSDFLGMRSASFEGKLRRAKEIAIIELKNKAYRLGANAVLGADIQYMSIGKNMLMVVISGTPVSFANEDESSAS